MKKYLLVVFVVILSACSPAITSTPVQEIATEIAPTPAPVSTALKYYPLDTMTQIEEIDLILYRSEEHTSELQSQ